MQRTDELRQIVSPQDREKADVAQMPKITSTMCNRPLYLEPGIDMRHLGEHPASVTTDVRDPNPPQTTISWLAGINNTLIIYLAINSQTYHVQLYFSHS